MKVREEIEYPGGMDAVFSMLCDPAYRRRVCEAAYAIDHSVSVRPEGNLVIVSIVRVMPADVPSVAKAIVGDRIEIKQVERWAADEQAWQRTADLSLEFVGHPAHMSGRILLTAADGVTRGTIDGELHVNIPFFAGRIADAMVQGFRFALSVEVDVATEYLSG
jgi:hypothetical protein